MSGWDYYNPSTGRVWSGGSALLDFATDAKARVETVGASELPLMLRARASVNGGFVLIHGRNCNRARLAARRLVLRGLLTRRTLGSPHAGYTHIYRLTERGRTCWLRARR